MTNVEITKAMEEIANDISNIKQAACSVIGQAEMSLKKLSQLYTELVKNEKVEEKGEIL